MLRFDYHVLANSQDQGAELEDILKNGPGLRLEYVPIPRTNIHLYLISPSPQLRPFIATSFKRQIFDTLHSLSHPGAKATVKLVSQRFVWPGVEKDSCAWICPCTACQRSKVTRHLKTPLGNFTLLRHVSLVHIDLVGLLPVSSGLRYSLTSPYGLSLSVCLRSPPKQSLRPSSVSGFLVSAVPIKSQLI